MDMDNVSCYYIYFKIDINRFCYSIYQNGGN